MAEDFSKLSQEQLKQFNSVISQLKELPDRQLEIVEKVLASEQDIGKLRISYLNDYFGSYYKGLDEVARKYSQLGDAFLILDKYATDSNKNQEQAQEQLQEQALDAVEELEEARLASLEDTEEAELTSLKERHELALEYIDDETATKMTAAEDYKNSAKKVSDFINSYTKLSYKTAEELENEFFETRTANNGALTEFDELRFKDREGFVKNLANTEASVEESIRRLYNLRYEDEVDKANRVTAIRLANLQTTTEAEIDAQERINNLAAEIAYASQENYKDENGNDTGVNEAGANRARLVEAESMSKFLEEQELKRNAYIAKQELAAKRKNNGILSKEEATRIQKEAARKFDLESKNFKKLIKEREMLEAAKDAKKERKELQNLTKEVFTAETTTERYEALKKLTTNDAGEFDLKKTMTAAALAVSDLAKQLEGKIDEIAGYKRAIDTRLQGSKNEKYAGSYWDQLVRDMTSVGAINPYFKQEDFAKNIEALVAKGISFDLKQRAFLMTVSDKIASTFEVSNATLLRLVRIQQEDSTAGRLGMESALNAFLNEMYETSEYLSTVADSVRSSLEEMESLMSGAEAAEVEFQVQKWLGSLYSVGMSDSAVTSISNALGQIAAGQIEGLTSSGAGNLLIMAANDAGIPIADILTRGITADETNKLLQASVNYLAELADSAKDNKIVQQQLANVFGVKASDLKAATNLVAPGSVTNIFGKSMTYDNMLSQLANMAGSMGSRTSIAEMMTNFWENGSYTLAGSMASNPVSYFIYKMAKVVDDAAGGIDLPFLNVMGFGVDLNTTVSDLMRVAAVGSGILGSIGPMISGLGSSFSGRAMLDKLGIGTGSGLAVVARGDGGGSSVPQGGGTQSTSGSGYVGNSSGNDVKNSTIQESEDSKKQQMIEAKEEEEANQVDVLNQTVIKMYELLDAVATGKSSFNVRVEGYGLTKAGLGSSNALAASAVGGTGGSNYSSSSGITNSEGLSGNASISGWTTSV